jgi:hypothetical protein
LVFVDAVFASRVLLVPFVLVAMLSFPSESQKGAC